MSRLLEVLYTALSFIALGAFVFILVVGLYALVVTIGTP